MSKRLYHLVRGLMAVAVLFSIAHATPEPAAWRRTMLLGDSDEYFFRYVTDSVHPGSYSTYSRTLRLEKVRKSDDRVVQSVPLRPRVVGIEQTGPDANKDLYLRIVSGSESWDDDWSEDLLMIHGALLR